MHPWCPWRQPLRRRRPSLGLCGLARPGPRIVWEWASPNRAVRDRSLARWRFFFFLTLGESDASIFSQDTLASPGAPDGRAELAATVSPSGSASLLPLPLPTQDLPPIVISRFYRQSAT